MPLYLHEDITPDVIREAKKASITGVKSYPADVTMNSSLGVVDYAIFYPVFEEMQNQDTILNLHGECPSGKDITIMSAEEGFFSRSWIYMFTSHGSASSSNTALPPPQSKQLRSADELWLAPLPRIICL